MSYLISFFIPMLGPSSNKWATMKGTKNKNGSYWNPKTQYTEKYEILVKDAILKYNLNKIESPFFISYFPIVGGNVEFKDKAAKSGLDCDNYAGSTKIIQDQLTRQNIIEDDNTKFLKGVFFNTFHKDKKLFSGFFIVIEVIQDQRFPNLNNHMKLVDKYIKEELKKC